MMVMKIKQYYRRILALLLLFVFAAPAMAQVVPGEVVSIMTSPPFFISILAGLILVLGFQALLTFTSVASGISLIGNVEEKGKTRGRKHDSNKNASSSEDKTSTGVKVSSAAGIWTVVTMSISLFFASLLAVRLSLVSGNVIGITLGLVIWAAFMLTAMFIEMR